MATPKELVDRALASLAPRRPRGPRVAIVGDGGGTGVVTADLVTAAGLELPPLSDGLAARLTAIAPSVITVNPVDLAGAGEQDFWNFERVTSAVLGSGEVDAVLFTGYFGGYSQMNERFSELETEVAHAIARAAAESPCVLLAQAMHWRAPPAAALRAGGVPTYRDVEAAVDTLAQLVEQQRGASSPACPTSATQRRRSSATATSSPVSCSSEPACRSRRPVVPPRSRQARSLAAELGYPVAVKALGLLHKSDAGGVALDLADDAAVAAAVTDMERRLAPEGFSVETMVDTAGGVELIVGCRRDPRFGPLVLVGLGGVYAELLRDVRLALAPAGADELEALLLSLRGAGVLTGARGRAPVDVRAAAEAAAALSRCRGGAPGDRRDRDQPAARDAARRGRARRARRPRLTIAAVIVAAAGMPERSGWSVRTRRRGRRDPPGWSLR